MIQHDSTFPKCLLGGTDVFSRQRGFLKGKSCFIQLQENTSCSLSLSLSLSLFWYVVGNREWHIAAAVVAGEYHNWPPVPKTPTLGKQRNTKILKPHRRENKTKFWEFNWEVHNKKKKTLDFRFLTRKGDPETPKWEVQTKHWRENET